MKTSPVMIHFPPMLIIASCAVLFMLAQSVTLPELFAQSKPSKSKAKTTVKTPAKSAKENAVKADSIKNSQPNSVPQQNTTSTPPPAAQPVVEVPAVVGGVKVITSTIPTFQVATRLPENAAARPKSPMGFIDVELSLPTTTGTLWGTLTVPNNASSTATVPLVLILNSNTVFDRNGVSRNNRDSNNHGKYLAEALAKQGIASFRYDTRGVAQSISALKGEENLDFEKTISDAAGWLTMLRKDKRFSTFTVFGSSRPGDFGREASLAATVVAWRMNADGLICIAPESRRYLAMLRAEAAMAFPEHTSRKVDSLALLLEQGKRFELKSSDGFVYNLFRPSLLLYVLGLNKYDPCTEFAKIQIPSMVVYGTNDFTLPAEIIQKFAAANPLAQCVSIKDMTFNLKNGKEDNATPSLQKYKVPIMPGLVTWVVEYVYSVNKR